MSDVTRILSAIEQGDAQAAEKLLPLVYDELRKVAAARKLLLLLRLSGLLLRLADCACCALLSNDPPRNTRLPGLRPLEFDCSEHPTA